MQIKTVTLTGADYSVGPESLSELAHEFPFVEFGILFSKSRQGSRRYPTKEWIGELTDVATSHHIDTGRPLNLAAHLCGDYARQFIHGYSDVWLDEWSVESHYFERIQLNITDADFMDTEFLGLAVESARGSTPWKEVIVQTKRPFERATYLSSANVAIEDSNIALVYDASGGRGISPKSWPKPPTASQVRVGYAGGIGPHNVEEVCKEITALPDHLYDTWIDMETSIRDAVGFSLDHCREVLSKARRYVRG